MNDSYIYNQSWEDSEIDNTVYNLVKNNKILMIITGGDNVLNYLLNNPKFIDTVDCNKHQNYLLELKIALIKTLDRDTCFEILGKSTINFY